MKARKAGNSLSYERQQYKILMIVAHIDDNNFRSAGIALKYLKTGHSVRFLSVSNVKTGTVTMCRSFTRWKRDCALYVKRRI